MAGASAHYKHDGVRHRYGKIDATFVHSREEEPLSVCLSICLVQTRARLLGGTGQPRRLATMRFTENADAEPQLRTPNGTTKEETKKQHSIGWFLYYCYYYYCCR